MSTTTPSLRTQLTATIKRCTVIVGVVVGFAIGCQVGSGPDQTGDSRPTAVPAVQTAEPQEDDPAFDCRIHGNDICGPTGEHEAGCYNAGVLVQPWSDELYGVFESPCTDISGTYDVPGGSLTVYEDSSARYQPSA